VTEGVPQAAEAVAVPSAALISEAEGLHPSVGVTPETVITGGLGAYTQVTVLEAVDELPQASTAVNVLTCEAEHEVVDTAPSVADIVTGPQASLAVAVPSAALISEAEGLHPRVFVVPVGVITGDV
jgi:GH24 family phage-related lysozyme (muramidase)